MDTALKLNVGKKKVLMIVAIVFAVIMIALVGTYLAFESYYTNHFLKGTNINGMDISKMTISLLNEKIQEYTLIVEEKTADGEIVKETIKASEIGLKISSSSGLQEILKNQKGGNWLFASGKSEDIANITEYDEELFQKRLEELQCFSEDFIQKSVDAYIEPYDEATNQFELVAAEYGNEPDKEKIEEVLKNAVDVLDEKVSLEEEECYLLPEITETDKKLVAYHKKLNQYTQTNITYQFGDKVEELKGTQIVTWIVQNDEEMQVSLDEEKVSEYVKYLSRTYDTAYTKRNFMTSYGVAVDVTQGDYGWKMNRTEEVAALIQAIEDGQSGARTPIYITTAVNYSEQDYGNTYVEINLTAQHLFLYSNGQKVLETDFVSGNMGTHDTPDGIYGVTYTQRNATLRGPGYATLVYYWMPFNGDIGLHDAYWRDGFGYNIYQGDGSHGCINLPLNMAKEIYEYVQTNTPVICYHLAGTETLPPDANGENPSNAEGETQVQGTETTTPAITQPQTTTRQPVTTTQPQTTTTPAPTTTTQSQTTTVPAQSEEETTTPAVVSDNQAEEETTPQ